MEPVPWCSPGAYRVVLFYRYVAIDDVDGLCTALRERCEAVGLLGRVLVASEGVNGTLAGAPACIDAFTEWMASDPRFTLIDWKTSDGAGPELPFLNLSIRATSELVSVGGPQRALLAARAPFDPTTFGGLSNTGTHLSPKEFHDALRDTAATKPLLVDVRNQFEYDIGHFDQAAPLNCATYAGTSSSPAPCPLTYRPLTTSLYCINSFQSRGQPWTASYTGRTPHRPPSTCTALGAYGAKRYETKSREETDSNTKTLILYCTGGIRCEKVRLPRSLRIRYDRMHICANEPSIVPRRRAFTSRRVGLSR